MVVVAAATGIAGCSWLGDVIEPGYLINESGQELTVSVSMPRQKDGAGGAAVSCRLDPKADPIKIAHVRAVYEKRANDWRPASLTAYDAETCSATMSLPPDSALLMFWNGSCSDYRKYLPNPNYAPTLQRLTISGGGRSLDLTGYDTSKAFKASSWRRDCRLVIK
jgi:hypothetical protein